MAVASKGGDAMQILAIKAPSLTSEELHDVAIFCGAHFIDKNLGIELTTVQKKHLGYVKKVSVTEDEVNMFGGQGDTKSRVEVLKEQIELEKDAMFKEKKKRRLANLTSGIGIIRVGAQTETERSYLKEKLKDAVSAAKVALDEGYVAGGGMSFVQAAKVLGEDSIIYNALMAPHKRIINNAGGDLEIPKNIINPLKVDRLALENACSGAGMLITSDGAIAEEKLTYMDYLEKAMKKSMPRDERDDWRDEENQDLGRGNVIN
jgi:chaperonin GroEL